VVADWEMALEIVASLNLLNVSALRAKIMLAINRKGGSHDGRSHDRVRFLRTGDWLRPCHRQELRRMNHGL
jgi:hypothetical protein